MFCRPPISTLFPYTTLFRSHPRAAVPPDRELQDVRPGGPAHQRRPRLGDRARLHPPEADRKSTRLNSSHLGISYAVFCLKKKKKKKNKLILVGNEPLKKTNH